jgi:hypothetical protein
MTTPDSLSLPITDEDIGRAASALNETEDLWAKIASMADPTIACPACGGTGTFAGGGIFGEIPCDQCDGQRMVEHPAAAEIGRLARPEFGPVRQRLLVMGQHLDVRRRAEYVNGTTGSADSLPPVPTRNELAELEKEIAALREKGREQAVKALEAPTTGSRDRRDLPAPERPRNTLGSLGGGKLSED